jgi:hypothetical protein
MLPHCADLDDGKTGKGRVLDMDAFLLIPKALPATSVEPGPRGSDLAVCELRHTVECTINFGTFLAGLSFMLAGLRGTIRGDDDAVA